MPEDADQEDGQEHLQGRRRTRSNRLEKARRHLDMWGRRGRGQPGRYLRAGMVMMGSEVVEENPEDILNDSGYFGDMDIFEHDIDDGTVSLPLRLTFQILKPSQRQSY